MRNISIFLLLFYSYPSTATDIDKDSLLVEYIVHYDKTNGNIVITDCLNDSSFIWGKIPDCSYKQRNFAEFHKPNLYVIREFNMDRADWRKELWVYSDMKNGDFILSGKGLEFKVNKTQTLLSYSNFDTLNIRDLESGKTTKITITDNFESSIGFMGWNNEKDEIWGMIESPGTIDLFFKYDCKIKKLFKLKVPEDCYSEYDINPNLGELLYSDYPFIIDALDSEQILKSKTRINLYVLNFETNAKTLIKTSEGKEFSPQWIKNETIEINSNENNKRIRIKYKK